MSNEYKQTGIILSHAPRIIKFGFLCTNRETLPKWFGVLCFFIFKLETLALLARTSKDYLKNDSTGLEAVIKVYVNIFTWTNWLSTSGSVPTIVMCFLIFGYLLVICGAAVYLTLKLSLRTPIKPFVQAIWALICYFHPLVFFLPIHTFCLEAIKRASDDAYTDGLSIVFRIIFYVNLMVNFLLAFCFIKVFHVVIKNKDPIASKNNILKFKDLFMKTILPIIALFADETEGLKVFLMVLIVFDAVTRDMVLFYYLPYYRIRVLEMLSMIQGSLTPLSVIILLTKLLEDTKLNLGLRFAALTWVLVSPIGIKLYYSFLWRLLLRVLMTMPSQLNVYHLLHKRIILRYFMKKRGLPHADTFKVSWFHYLVQAKFSDLTNLNDITMEELDKSFLDQISKKLSLEITKNHSKSSLAKACLAQFYVKKENAYLLANNIIEEVLSRIPSFSVKISLCLIRFDLQKKLFIEYSNQGKDEGGGLNVLEYVTSNKKLEQMKLSIKKQVKVQQDFWQNYLESKPNMGELVEAASRVDSLKSRVKHDWKELQKFKNPYFTYPYLIYGLYLSLANNDGTQGEKYTEFYYKENSRKSKLNETDEMNSKTLFCENTVQLSMSGSRTKLGRLLDCSSNIAQVYGWKKNFIVDRPVNLLMSAYYRNKHDRILLHHFNTGQANILNKTRSLPLQTSEGYTAFSWFHLKMNPIVEHGISYIAVMRPVNSSPRAIFVRRDGTIDTMTKNVAEELGVAGHPDLHNMKIFTLCPDFRAVNTAFNVVINKMMKENNDDSQTLEYHPDEDLSQDNTSRYTRRKFSQSGTPFNNHGSNHSSFPQFTDVEMKSQTIFDSFTTGGGSTLVFYPQKNFSIEGNKIKIFTNGHGGNYKNDAQPVCYNVQISTQVYEKDLLKILTLEKVDKTPEILLSRQSYHTEKETMDEKKESYPQPPNLASNPFMSPKEEQNLLLVSSRPPLNSDSRLLVLSPKNNPLATEITNSIPDEIEEVGEEFPTPLNKKNVRAQGNAVKKSFFQIVEQVKNIHQPKKSVDSKTMHQQSSYEEKANEPKQEEGLLRAKLKRLREKINKGIVEHNQEGSISSSILSKGRKAQTLVAEALEMVVHRKTTLVFIAAFFMFIGVILGLQIFQAVNVFVAVENLKKKTTVIGNAAYKLNSLMMVNFYSRLLDGVYDGMYAINNDVSTDGEAIKSQIGLYAKTLYKYNNLLIDEVSTLSSEFQEVFYEKDVRVFETDDDGKKILLSTDNNFAVTSTIIEHTARLLASSNPTAISTDRNSDLNFILTNTLDDLLVSSEDSMDVLYADLDSTLKNIRKRILVAYLLVVVALVCFLGATIRFLFQMRAQSARFGDLFFRLENSEAEEINGLLRQFVSSLDNIEAMEIPEEHRGNHLDKAKSPSASRTHFRHPDMGKFYKAQILVVLKLFPFYLIVFGWTLGSYLNTKNIISQLVDQEDQIQLSLGTLYQQNLIMTEITGLLLTNNSMTVRNRGVETDFLYNIDQMPTATALVNAFRSSDGSLTSAEQEAFSDFPCSSFNKYTIDNLDSVVSSCEDMSQGANSVSLLTALSLFYSTTTKYYELYVESSKTMGEIIEMNENFINDFSDVGLVSPAMCTVLYQISIEDFNSQTKSANTNALIFAVFTVAALLIGTVYVWYFAMKKIFDIENSDKHVLKLVPVETLLSNRYLKQYLIKNSHDKLERMKHLL